LRPGGALLLLALLAASAPPEVEILRPDAAVERRLAGGESHTYRIDLQSGDYARLVADQRGVDVVLSVTGPDAEPLLEADSPTDRFGPETASVVAAAAGSYGLTIRTADPLQSAGSYLLRLEALRPATPADVQRTAAEHLAAEGYRRASSGRSDDLEAALAAYRRAVDLARRLGDAGLEGEVRYRLGTALLRRGEKEAALAELEKTLALRQAAGDGAGTARAFNQMGRVYRAQSQPAQAFAAYAEALAACERSGAPELAATVYNNLGLLQQETGRREEALASYQRALGIYRQSGDRRSEATTANNLGGLLASLGRSSEALAQYQTALGLARRLQRRDLEANLLNNLGDLYSAVSRPREAVESLSSALAIFRELGDVPRRAAALNNLGTLLADLGDAEQGHEMLRQALALHSEPRKIGLTQLNLGRTARDLGRPDEALQWLAQAGARLHESGDRAGEAQALYFRAAVQLDLGEPAKARATLEEAALPAFRELGDLTWQQSTLRMLGRCLDALGDRPGAARSFAAALALADSLGDAREQGRILVDRARSQSRHGDLAAARRDIEAALERLESLRAAVGGEHLRATFLASIREAYELEVDLLLRLHAEPPDDGLAALAFAAAERSKARALLDFLAHSEIEIQTGDPALTAAAGRLREELAARAAQRMELLRDPEKAAEAAALAGEIDSLTAEASLAEARLRAGDPRYAALQAPAMDIAAAQRLLDGDTVLLEYALGEERSWLWVVSPSAFAVHALPGRERIEILARRVHEHLRLPNGTAAAGARGDLTELSRLLLGPVPAELRGKRLAVVADGALHYIPFAVLPVPDEEGGAGKAAVPLIVRQEVISLPSAAALREIRREAAGRRPAEADLAVFADPVYGGDALTRLSWSRREAERIAGAAAGREVLLALGFRARRDLALSPEIARYRILHFATHGFLDTDHPDLSGLVLSQWDEQGRPEDGFLRLQDIYGLNLRADLVVLSGCATALGKRLSGEGLLGLTRGFLHAGAAQVVASLWEVRDRAAAELMERFYSALYRDGLRPSAALRRAQVEMWSRHTWRDPYFWAAFTLQGDWQAGAP
jgi:CHAT domain-containing protein/Tfp pilus assembly protein PilF